ncbi:glucose-6-phosphate dehydrogenase [Alcaligenaceae bacterium A4P071]|nr:glucose-6-phosphate dehydrogenase [Alcaligenaceae bacterium B3P038]MDQ2185138.1 glucose-6-phosphate dehydrogenase [Alcaligenaceae bacterium A4P071]
MLEGCPDRLDLVIFGGNGDLSMRKLLPALYICHRDENLPAHGRIACVGRNDFDDAAFQAFVESQARPFVDDSTYDEAVWKAFLQRLHFIRVDATKPEDYATLGAWLAPDTLRIFFLATSSDLFIPICDNLAAAELILKDSRLLLEKPLGKDIASAREINAAADRYFDESRIYRIDHYLGKETVQNLMALRFGNSIFEPLWRAPTIRNVQITVSETVGVGTRGGFYDRAGALRDMVQNHLLQLLCIVAMEPPAQLDSDAVRDEKIKVLRSLSPMSLADISRWTVRGQYAAGSEQGEAVPGYLDEKGIPADSNTETFVALRAHVNTWRWANVPFFLRTGKRMPQRVSEIVINFADVPYSIFSSQAILRPNRLVISLQRNEAVKLQMMAKVPGDGMRLKPVNLDFDFNDEFTSRRADAYERLLLDLIRGRQTLFIRRDETEAAWSWVEPILRGWQQLGDRPRPYNAGTWGPAASSSLMASEGTQWAEEL